MTIGSSPAAYSTYRFRPKYDVPGAGSATSASNATPVSPDTASSVCRPLPNPSIHTVEASPVSSVRTTGSRTVPVPMPGWNRTGAPCTGAPSRTTRTAAVTADPATADTP
jgi:hypothetical protein